MYASQQAMKDIAIGLAPIVLDNTTLDVLARSIPPVELLPKYRLLDRTTLLRILTNRGFPPVLDGKILSKRDLSEGERWQIGIHYQLYRAVMIALHKPPLDEKAWLYGSHFINDKTEKRQSPHSRWTSLVRSGATIGNCVRRTQAKDDHWRLTGISPTCMVTLAQSGQTMYTTPGSLVVCRGDIPDMKN